MIGRFFKQFGKTCKSLWGIILLGVLLAIAGILLHESTNHATALFGLGLSELGFAFLIATILFGTFEEWAAREHKKSAIAHIYGMKPDDEVFDMIEDHVLKQRFYRSRLVVTYAFRKQVGENILVEQTTKYLVTNVCSRYNRSNLELAGNADLKPLHAGDTDWDADLGLQSLTLIRKCGEERNREEIAEEKILLTPDADARTEGFEVKQEILLALDETIGVEVVHHLVMHDHDSTAWTSAFPCTDLEFRVTWDEPIRLKVVLSATHPKLQKLTPESEPNGLVVKLSEPFLKGHGIHFRWSPDTVLASVAAASPRSAPAQESA